MTFKDVLTGLLTSIMQQNSGTSGTAVANKYHKLYDTDTIINHCSCLENVCGHCSQSYM